MTRPLVALFIATAALLLASAPAPAQQAWELDNYRVHYNALNTSTLPPEVARAYGIQRSANRAILNIAVLRKADSADDMATPVRADLSARAVNLTGQARNIALEEIVDDEAIYYIGSFRIHNEETLTFTIRIQPEDSDQPAREFSFTQQFFTD